MPNLIGSLAILATVLTGTAALGANETGYLLSVVVSIAAILAGLRFWVDPLAPDGPGGWASGILMMVTAGAVVFGLETVLGKLLHPNLGFVEAGFRTGPFGGIATATVTAGATLVAVGGFFRSLALKWRDRP